MRNSKISTKYLDDFIENENKKEYIFNIDLGDICISLELRKDSLKRTIIENYLENIDYKIIKISYKGKSGNQITEKIYLTDDIFKYICMKSVTPNAEIVRSYLIFLEKSIENEKNKMIIKLEKRIEEFKLQKIKEINKEI